MACLFGSCESAPNFDLKNLVVVPGHAAFKSNFFGDTDDFSNPDLWSLLPYQKEDVRFYLEHIYSAMELASRDEKSLLVFSGSWTRRESGVWSEAASYKAIADSKCNNCKNGKCTLPNRITLEEFSFDSFQNLQNSVQLFEMLTGRKPDSISVVGWSFKSKRFEFHCRTIGYPLNRFNYIGVNNPGKLLDAEACERVTLELFLSDPLGSGDTLSSKRVQRDVLGINKARKACFGNLICCNK